MSDTGRERHPVLRGLGRLRELLWRLVVTTAGSCLRYRVTGLAAEAAFFAVLSIPRWSSRSPARSASSPAT
ncbi:MAG: hypothetical protein R2731_02370 [Nocardioides sp.]